jgi:hypothetical protein
MGGELKEDSLFFLITTRPWTVETEWRGKGEDDKTSGVGRWTESKAHR